MPVYNGEEYIAEALDSLLAQTFSDFEIIVYDNVSTDSTASIVQSYAFRDRRVRLCRQTSNIGAAENFIAVLQQASGRFFMWAAHDDIWAENWLEVLVRNFTEDDVGIRGHIKLQHNTQIMAVKVPPDFERGQNLRYFLRNETDYRSHYIYSLFDREKLLRVDIGVLVLDYYPDALFVYEVLKYGNIRMINDTYQIYRLHDESEGSLLAKRWRGPAKILYRVHPLRYYRYYLAYTDGGINKALLFCLIPIKHIYAQVSFWMRGIRQIVTGVKYL